MKRICKKAAYAARGIVYAAGRILAPLGYGFIPELLKTGNVKTGRAVKTWSMSTSTCPCHCKGCYAETGCYRFANVRAALDRHADLARRALSFVENALRAQLSTFPAGTEIRIHAAGDFFSAEYVEMWRGIVKDFPALKFWTYTKYAPAVGAFDEFPNGNIVKSIVPGVGLNFGHCDYIANAYDKMKAAGMDVHICKCGIDPAHHCAGCAACSNHEFVLFIEHSTAYKAANDPALDRVRAIIAEQEGKEGKTAGAVA